MRDTTVWLQLISTNNQEPLSLPTATAPTIYLDTCIGTAYRNNLKSQALF